jgi:hypothetical protein
MKLVIATLVEEFQNDVLNLFKEANIESFSSSDIDGHKNASTILKASNWLSTEKGGTDSRMLFSFTDDERIDFLFKLIKDYNSSLEINSMVRSIVLPIERFI